MSFYIADFSRENKDGGIFAGRTEVEAVAAAREEINKWQEYCCYSDEEIAMLASEGELDFELVAVPEDFPADRSAASLRRLLEKYSEEEEDFPA